MTSNRWRQVNDAFLELARLTAGEREARLARLESDDPELRCEVQKLLAGDAQADNDGFLQDSPLHLLQGGAAVAVGSGAGSSELNATETSGVAGSSGADRSADGTKPAIPEFDLIRKLDSGGFGDVWLACSRSGVYRAVKILPRTLISAIEIQGLRTYETFGGRHPNLIDVRHVGETPQSLYYVMELADGYSAAPTFDPEDYLPRTLKSELRRRGALPPAEAVTIARQALAGLAHLHANGLLHRDIKPANIVFVGGVAKLADIGLLARDDAQRRVGQTPDYAPPGGVSDRSGDLYCLGRALAEMLCGELPPAGRAATTTMSTERCAAVAPFVGLIEKACAAEPANRFQSAADFERDLASSAGLRTEDAGRAAELRLAPIERQRRTRHLAHWRNATLAAVAAVFLGVALLYPTPPTRGDVQMTVVPRGRSTDAEIAVEKEFPLKADDKVRFRVTLDRPGYPLLAVITPDGEPDIVYPRAGAEQQRVKALDIPPDDSYWPLPDGNGCILVVLLVSDKPIGDLDAVRARLRDLPAPDISADSMVIADNDRPRTIPRSKPERARGAFDESYTRRVKDGAIRQIRERFEREFPFVFILAVPQVRS